LKNSLTELIFYSKFFIYIAEGANNIHQFTISEMAEKKKLELEYTFNSSPKILFHRLSTADGLAEWFADDVYVKGKVFTFIWEGNEQKAELIHKKESTSVKFRWLEETDKELFFEFRISVDDLTGDVALVITDFTEDDEMDDTMELWDTQISELKHIIGL